MSEWTRRQRVKSPSCLLSRPTVGSNAPLLWCQFYCICQVHWTTYQVVQSSQVNQDFRCNTNWPSCDISKCPLTIWSFVWMTRNLIWKNLSEPDQNFSNIVRFDIFRPLWLCLPPWLAIYKFSFWMYVCGLIIPVTMSDYIQTWRVCCWGPAVVMWQKWLFLVQKLQILCNPSLKDSNKYIINI